MKKLILFIVGFLVLFECTAQIEISETYTEDLYKSSSGAHRLTKLTVDTTVFYGFYFRDAQFKQIVDYKYISFNSLADVNDFFNLVIRSIDEKKDFQVHIGREDVSITNVSKTSSNIWAKGGYCSFNRKQAEELLLSINTP